MHTDQQHQHQQPDSVEMQDDSLESNESSMEASATDAPAELSESANAPTESPVESTDSTEGIAAAAEDADAPFAGMVDPGLETLTDGSDGETDASLPQPIEYRDLVGEELQSAVEALLFMNHKPLTIGKIRELIHPKIAEDDYRTAISNLMASYFDDAKGIELVEVANGYQFRTKEVNKDIIRRMYQITPVKLTNAMLEVLAIAAYNQPITKEDLEKVRGVDSSHLVRALLEKRMLRIVGKSEDIGKPLLYGTTKEFLELFGLRDLTALPSLREIEDMLPKNEVGSISEEDALAQEMNGIAESSKPLEFNDLELEEVENEAQETQEAHQEQPSGVELSSQTYRSRRTKIISSTDDGQQAGDNVDIAPEIAGRLPIGPEGNA